MTSSQVYPTIPCGTIDSQQMCGDVVAGMVSTDWYAPSLYAYHNEPYITPYPSMVEGQPWPSYDRSSAPDMPAAAYNVQQQHHQAQPQANHHYQASSHFKDPNRPRSSPSTFGPGPEGLVWPATSGLGIQYTSIAGGHTPPTSTYPPSAFHYPSEGHYNTATSSAPEIRHPQPRKPYTSIAPNPTGIVSVKRPRDDDERTDSSLSTTKRRKRASSVASADLSEDDRFLVKLKEEDSLPWKDIATRFHTDKGKNLQVAALQMRYKRLREKYRTWEDQDVNALRLAYEYWEKYKWEIISSKMPDFGIYERWPARHCARKWQTLENAVAAHATTTAGYTPGLSTQCSISPSETPMHFAFLPISNQ